MRKLIAGFGLLLATGCGGADVPWQVSGYMGHCDAQTPCAAPLVCMSDFARVSRCVAPVDVAHCGDPGQPCCKSYQADLTIAPPCRGASECQFYCAAGLRCDMSRATGAPAVCAVD